LEEIEVHAAHEIALLLGEPVKLAVGKDDLRSPADLGFVAVAGEDVDDGLSAFVRPGGADDCVSGFLSHLLPSGVGGGT
jgi:hypothetical protein